MWSRVWMFANFYWLYGKGWKQHGGLSKGIGYGGGHIREYSIWECLLLEVVLCWVWSIWPSLLCFVLILVALRFLESMGVSTAPFKEYGQSPHYDSGFQTVCLKKNLDVEGWTFQAHGEFPGNFESRNLSLEETGRKCTCVCVLLSFHCTVL